MEWRKEKECLSSRHCHGEQSVPKAARGNGDPSKEERELAAGQPSFSPTTSTQCASCPLLPLTELFLPRNVVKMEPARYALCTLCDAKESDRNDCHSRAALSDA
jgi:hypothetical protein